MTFDLSATRFSKSNALYCADPCKRIYATNAPFWIEDVGDFIIFVVRGSKLVQDWIKDAEAWQTTVWKGTSVRIHYGFEMDWQMMKLTALAQLKSIDKTATRPMVVTGHSLGAAVCVRACEDIPNPIAQIYTFGEPRVWNEAGSEAFDLKFGPRCYRVVAKLDIVPRVPFIGYWHHDNEVLLTGDGYRVDPSWWQRLTTDCWLEWRGFLKRKLANVDEALQDHHMETSYIPLLESLK